MNEEERKINMIKYFKMKAMEIEIKYALYSIIVTFVKEQNDFIEFAKRLYDALKDVPIEELRKELISNIAELVHEQAVKEREAEKSA